MRRPDSPYRDKVKDLELFTPTDGEGKPIPRLLATEKNLTDDDRIALAQHWAWEHAVDATIRVNGDS